MVRSVVHDFVVHPGWSKFVLFKNKITCIKARIRNWHLEVKSQNEEDNLRLHHKLNVTYLSIEEGNYYVVIVSETQNILREMVNLDKIRSSNATQKSKGFLVSGG